MSQTLESLLKITVGEGDDEKPVVEFSVKVQKTYDRGVHFLICPVGVHGETIDFMVSDNLLTDLKK